MGVCNCHHVWMLFCLSIYLFWMPSFLYMKIYPRLDFQSLNENLEKIRKRIIRCNFIGNSFSLSIVTYRHLSQWRHKINLCWSKAHFRELWTPISWERYKLLRCVCLFLFFLNFHILLYWKSLLKIFIENLFFKNAFQFFCYHLTSLLL